MSRLVRVEYVDEWSHDERTMLFNPSEVVCIYENAIGDGSTLLFRNGKRVDIPMCVNDIYEYFEGLDFL